MAAPLHRYFLHQWPSLCVFACDGSGTPVGTIVAKVHSFAVACCDEHTACDVIKAHSR
jgi:hypothetical protein